MRNDYPLLFALAAVGLTVGCQQALRVGPLAAPRLAPEPEIHADRDGNAAPGAAMGARDSG